MRIALLLGLLLIFCFCAAAPAQAADAVKPPITIIINGEGGGGNGTEAPDPNTNFLNFCLPHLDGSGCLFCIGLAGPTWIYDDLTGDEGLGIGVGTSTDGATVKVGNGVDCPKEL